MRLMTATPLVSAFLWVRVTGFSAPENSSRRPPSPSAHQARWSVGVLTTTAYRRRLLPFELPMSPIDETDNGDGGSTTTAAEEVVSVGSAKPDVLVDAESALANVGWYNLPAEGELTSDDPFVQMIDAGIQADTGVTLDDLLNPAKVVNLERDLVQLRLELAELTGRSLDDGSDKSPSSLRTTAECDGGGGGSEADELRQKISKKETDLALERRSVFRGWLKNVFLVQAVISFVLSYVMATNPASLFGGFGWFYSYNMDVSIQVLGYWWWWLFVVPSLRSRRPKGAEKRALDLAFIGTPAISLLAPVLTRDTGIIWAANFAVVAASYAVAYLGGEDGDDDDNKNGSDPEWLKFVYKSLDFGSGRERGARK